MKATPHYLSRALLIVLAFWACAGHAALVSIPGLYNTGVDDNNAVMSIGSMDTHYVLSGPEGLNAAYVGNPVVIPPQWVTAPAGSAWIDPDPTGNNYPYLPPGNYYYDLRLTINLDRVQAGNLQIAGAWATDNTGQIYVNGLDTGYNKGLFGFTQLDSFLLQGMFHTGDNTIDFLVNNQSGPSGLLVANLQAALDGSLTGPNPPPSPVPEPSTYLAGVLLLIPLGFQGFRKMKP